MPRAREFPQCCVKLFHGDGVAQAQGAGSVEPLGAGAQVAFLVQRTSALLKAEPTKVAEKLRADESRLGLDGRLVEAAVKALVSVGGGTTSSSGPVVLAAWLSRIPTAVQEQNALAGFTNRLLGKFVQAVFTAFPEAKTQFPEEKVRLLGNPIRRELMDNFLRARVEHPKFQLLVFGGSQGAHALNQAMLKAVPLLADLHDKLSITHQTGKKDIDEVRTGYPKGTLEVEVVEFIEDMSKAYARADLVVCRAGATTLANGVINLTRNFYGLNGNWLHTGTIGSGTYKLVGGLEGNDEAHGAPKRARTRPTW